MRSASLLLVGSILLGGCSWSAASKESLGDILAEYTYGLRWSRFDFMRPHLPKDGRLRFDPAPPRGVHLVTCEIESVNLSADAKRAQVAVRVEWTTARETRVRSTLLRQTWRLADNRWEIVDQRTAEGPPFPAPRQRPVDLTTRTSSSPADQPPAG